MDNQSKLIKIISRNSDRYGDKLVDFMDRYGLPNLASATENQLEEYIEANGLKWPKGETNEEVNHLHHCDCINAHSCRCACRRYRTNTNA